MRLASSLRRLQESGGVCEHSLFSTILPTTPDPHTILVKDLPDGGLVDAELFADIHRSDIIGIHLQDALGQGLS